MRREGLALAGAIALACSSATPALAGVFDNVYLGSTPGGGVQYYKATSTGDVSVSTCDMEETLAIGGGATISGSGANAGLNTTAPTDLYPTSWLATATSTGPARDVTAYAICSSGSIDWNNEATPVGAAGEDDDDVHLSDTCPEEDRVVGGVQANEGNDVRIIATRPSDATDWESQVRNYSENAASVTQWYSCNALPERTVRKASAFVKPGKSGKVTAKCKASEAVVGGGLASTDGGKFAKNTWATSTRPYDSKDDGIVPEDGWQAKIYNHGHGKTKLTSYALCL